MCSKYLKPHDCCHPSPGVAAEEGPFSTIASLLMVSAHGHREVEHVLRRVSEQGKTVVIPF